MKKSNLFHASIATQSVFIIALFIANFSFTQTFEDFRNTSELNRKVSLAESLAFDYTRGNLDSLRIIGHELLIYSNKLKNETGINTAKRIIGAYKIRTAQVDEGMELLRAAKNYFLSQENLSSATVICNEIGNGYQYSGKIDDAITWYRESIKYGELTTDENIRKIALVNLAQAYVLKSDFEKAEKVALDYRDWVLAIGALDAVANSYAVLGNIELQQENFADAISYFQYNEKFARKSGSKAQIAHAYTNLGISAFYLGEKDKCVDYFLQALELNKEINVTKAICDSYLNLGGVYFELGDYPNAEEYYMQGLEVAQNANMYASQKEFLEALIELKKAEGKSITDLNEELRLTVEKENLFVESQNKIDVELEKDLKESRSIERNGFSKTNSKLPLYIGSSVIFILFSFLALRKLLV